MNITPRTSHIQKIAQMQPTELEQKSEQCIKEVRKLLTKINQCTRVEKLRQYSSIALQELQDLYLYKAILCAHKSKKNDGQIPEIGTPENG